MILNKTGLDITKVNCDCSLIEEMFLARNLIQHANDIGTNWIYLDKQYAMKFPKAEFANRSWIGLGEDEGASVIMPAPIEITGGKIYKAIAEVGKLCGAIEAEFLTLTDMQQNARKVSAKLESGFLKRFVEFQDA